MTTSFEAPFEAASKATFNDGCGVPSDSLRAHSPCGTEQAGSCCPHWDALAPHALCQLGPRDGAALTSAGPGEVVPSKPMTRALNPRAAQGGGTMGASGAEYSLLPEQLLQQELS